MQGAVVAQLDELVVRQGVQLGFRDRVVFGDQHRLSRRAGVGVARGEGGLLGLEQVEFPQQGDEGIGAGAVLVELAAELDAALGELAGLAAFE